MKVYIAGRSEDQAKIAEIKAEFEASEIEVNAGWIQQKDLSIDKDGLSEKRRKLWIDLTQIAEADIFVLFNPQDAHRTGTGGRHVETGYAIALGKPIFLIGSGENIFHFHENVREFDSTQTAINAVLDINLEEFKASTHSVDSYQAWTRTTALYPGKGDKKALGVAYTTVGLGGETGELVDKVLAHLNEESNRLLMAGVTTKEETEALTNLGVVIEKLHHFGVVARQLEELKRPMREGKMPLPDLAPFPENLLIEIQKELGDQDWYQARLADELGVRSSQVLAANVEKLLSRKNRGVIHGSGDNR